MIYTSYKRDSRLALLSDFLFCFRRTAFVFSIFVLADYPSINLISLFSMNLMMTIYAGHTKSFRIRHRNRVELMNEYQFSIICYFMVVFTDFIQVTEQYEKGFIIIGLIIIFFVINMAAVIKNLVKSLFLSWKCFQWRVPRSLNIQRILPRFHEF